MSIYSRIYVAGHRGMVGSAILRQLQAQGQQGLITRAHDQLDLTDQAAVRAFFAEMAPEYVYLAAARVGGIHANTTYPAEFIYQNLMIEVNLVEAAYRSGVRRLLFLGSSCIYPKFAPQPMPEAALLSGALEPSNEPYAIAKIAGIKLCESYNRQYGSDFRCVMPTNLYGENDNFHPQNSHVIPALMRRFHEARMANAPRVMVWGSGQARREFLHVDDLASACLHVMALPPEVYRGATEPMLSHLNIGTGEDISILELAQLIGEITGFAGEIHFDPSQPDGTPRKLLEVARVRGLGWRPQIGLREGLQRTYAWFLAQEGALRQ